MTIEHRIIWVRAVPLLRLDCGISGIRKTLNRRHSEAVTPLCWCDKLFLILKQDPSNWSLPLARLLGWTGLGQVTRALGDFEALRGILMKTPCRRRKRSWKEVGRSRIRPSSKKINVTTLGRRHEKCPWSEEPKLNSWSGFYWVNFLQIAMIRK